MNWFEDYKLSMNGKEVSPDLLGAGKASADQAMEHYRFQHQQKIKESIESSFSGLIEKIGRHEWEMLWNHFWSSGPRSPRSLDFFPDVFLEYLLKSELSESSKDLARFERLLETYPWRHMPVKSCQIVDNLSDDSKLELNEYDVESFFSPVIEVYQNEFSVNFGVLHTVIIWLTNDGVEFRYIQPWELKILSRLSLGLAFALEDIHEDTESVSGFFQWLRQSELIKEISDTASN